jgi:hypothetical protein
MAAAAGLSVTLIPVLMGYWIRGRIPDEQKQPHHARLIAVYRPGAGMGAALAQGHAGDRGAALATTAWPLSRWAANSCRRWTKATCCTCRRRCRGCRRRRPPSCCSSPTA